MVTRQQPVTLKSSGVLQVFTQTLSGRKEKSAVEWRCLDEIARKQRKHDFRSILRIVECQTCCRVTVGISMSKEMYTV